MTLGHLLFAGALTAYMGLAALIEERDLIAHFGRQYEEYRRRVPMFVPHWKGQPADVLSAQMREAERLRRKGFSVVSSPSVHPSVVEKQRLLAPTRCQAPRSVCREARFGPDRLDRYVGRAGRLHARQRVP